MPPRIQISDRPSFLLGAESASGERRGCWHGLSRRVLPLSGAGGKERLAGAAVSRAASTEMAAPQFLQRTFLPYRLAAKT